MKFKKKRTGPPTADDLFSGAGGWCLAANHLGIHARGIENMKEARATRTAAGLTTIHDDVWTFQPDGTAHGLIASPPCQTFSVTGNGSGRKALDDVLRGIRDNYVGNLDHLRFLGEEVGDNRTSLILTPLHFALKGKYEWLAWEQVPTVLPVWEACAETLRGKGWSVWTGVLRAEMFGVPQTRKRAFLLASRTHPVTPPPPTHSRYHSRAPTRIDPGLRPWVSMAEALPDRAGQALRSNYSAGGTEGQTAAERGLTTRSTDLPASTITSKGLNWLPDWAFTRPSTTIVGTFSPHIVASPDYRNTVSRQNAPDSVRVTVQEAGVLQSFPADYPWQGEKVKRFLQCGNAIPPGLALHAIAAAAAITVPGGGWVIPNSESEQMRLETNNA